MTNVQAEERLLGALMRKPESLADVRDVLTPDDFYRQTHREIYGAILSLAEQGTGIDMVSVSDELQRLGMLEKVGIRTLTDINGAEFTDAMVGKYADIIADFSKRRKLIDIGREIEQKAADLTEDVDVDAFQQRLSAVHFGGTDDGMADQMEAMLEFSAWMDAEYEKDYSGVMSGYKDLDDITSGFREGDLAVLAARPSMGKTALAVCMFSQAMRDGICPVFYSLEMTKQQIMSRMNAAISGVDSRKIMQPKSMSSEEWDAVTSAKCEIAKYRFLLTDKRGMTIRDIAASARRAKAKHGIGLVIVDHLQLLHSGRKREENRTNELDYISFGLKLIAGELRIPVLVLSQLSRGVESRNDKRPMLSDLRDSGAIEQNADIVMMMYRDLYYDRNGDERTEIAVKKNRNGGTGTAYLKFIPEYSMFMPLKNDFGGQMVKEVPNDF